MLALFYGKTLSSWLTHSIFKLMIWTLKHGQPSPILHLCHLTIQLVLPCQTIKFWLWVQGVCRSCLIQQLMQEQHFHLLSIIKEKSHFCNLEEGIISLEVTQLKLLLRNSTITPALGALLLVDLCKPQTAKDMPVLLQSMLTSLPIFKVAAHEEFYQRK